MVDISIVRWLRKPTKTYITGGAPADNAQTLLKLWIWAQKKHQTNPPLDFTIVTIYCIYLYLLARLPIEKWGLPAGWSKDPRIVTHGDANQIHDGKAVKRGPDSRWQTRFRAQHALSLDREVTIQQFVGFS